MSYINIENNINSSIRVISDHIIEVVGLSKITDGFRLYLDNGLLVGDYTDYKYPYRDISESIYQYSNNKSVYVEPIVVEPVIHIPTEEEIAEELRQSKINEIYNKISSIDSEFKSLDYVGIKIATGRATIEEYATEIDRMNELAIMKDKLEEELKTLWWKYYIYCQY